MISVINWWNQLGQQENTIYIELIQKAEMFNIYIFLQISHQHSLNLKLQVLRSLPNKDRQVSNIRRDTCKSVHLYHILISVRQLVHFYLLNVYIIILPIYNVSSQFNKYQLLFNFHQDDIIIFIYLHNDIDFYIYCSYPIWSTWP